jgi:hypothetical protein
MTDLIFRVTMRGRDRETEDIPLLFTGEQLKRAIDMGLVQQAELLGRIETDD